MDTSRFTIQNQGVAATFQDGPGEPPMAVADPARFCRTPLKRFQDQLTELGRKYSPCGDGFQTSCPLHRDNKPSLSFSEGKDKRLLLNCFSCGGSFAEIMEAFGLTAKQGFANCYDDIMGTGEIPLTTLVARIGQPDEQTVEIDKLTIEGHETILSWYREEMEAMPGKLGELARELSVTEDSLKRLCVGWRPRATERSPLGDDAGNCWIFPERDAAMRMIGLMRRYEDPKLGKRMMYGGHRGLYIPIGWEEIPGPIYIPEGMSDTAALISAGRCAIGRPSAKGGAPYLVRLLRKVVRQIIVLGERDPKPDGSWPGKEGMDHIAKILSEQLRRSIGTQLPPQGFKDVREYLKSKELAK